VDNKAFAKNVKQVFKNCMTYNNDKTLELYQCAVGLGDEFQACYSAWLESPDKPSNPDITELLSLENDTPDDAMEEGGDEGGEGEKGGEGDGGDGEEEAEAEFDDSNSAMQLA